MDGMTNENDLKKLVQSQFGRTADKYVSSKSHAQSDDLLLLINWLAPELTWTVLDIATGGGHVAKALSPHVHNVVAADLTKAMLEAARNHLLKSGCTNVSYIVADAESLPFLDNSFDAVTCRIAAHHFLNPKKFVSETYRVLKKNGCFVLIDNVSPNDQALAEYHNTFEKLRDPSHVRCPSITEWESWFQSVGFQIKKSFPKRKFYDFDSWAHRMVTSEEQLTRVEEYILSGADSKKGYFEVKEHNGKVKSLYVDEWMALCVKV